MKAKHHGRKKFRTEKRKGGRLGLAIAISATIIFAVVMVYTLLLPATPSLLGPGASAPDFRLPILGAQGISSEELRLSDLRGRVVFLEFMVSWCKACREMAPAVESLRLEYEPKGVAFISVAGSQGGATPESTMEFMRLYGTNWVYVFDSGNAAFSKYRVDSTPTYFILDQNGVIASRISGVTPTESFVQALDPLLSGGS